MWSEDQLKQLHAASLEILERTGVIVKDKKAREMLADAGALVKGEAARIPAWMVEEAIRSAPSKINLVSKDGMQRLNLYENNIYFGLGTDLPNFKDLYTDEIRPTLLSDIENVSKITQVSANIDFIASLGLASDVDQRAVDLYHFKAMRKYCNKPIWTTAVGPDNLKSLIDMAAVSAGGYDELRLKPSFGVYNEPVSPLVFSEEAVRKLMLCAEYGIPSTWAPGITAGGTGPMTFAACLAVGNAEGLGGLVIHQLTKKGAPFIYGIIFSAMDMKAATSPYGTPEANLGQVVAVELGKYYGLPTYGTGGVTEAVTIDAQAGLEAMFTNITNAMSGANLIHDNGYTGCGLIGSLEMILLDDEIAGYVKHFLKGFEISEETLALDVIHKVGHGGEYISHPHTFKTFKNILYDPRYLNRKQYPAWIQNGSRKIDEVLNERVREFLQKEMPVLLSDEEEKAYDQLIEKRIKELG